MRICSPRSWITALAAIGLLLIGGQAKAGFETATYAFTQSNTLANGVTYATIKLESYDGVGLTGDGLAAGQIKMVITALTTPYTSTGPNFGLDKFSFDYNLSNLTTANISTAPTNWAFSLTSNSSSPFGRFDADGSVSGANNNRTSVLTVLISNQGSEAHIANVTVLDSTGNPNHPTVGNYYFLAHIGDIVPGGSQYVAVNDLTDVGGGNSQLQTVPAPAGLILLASGLPILGLRCLMRRKAVAA
jgi:hypothetical protein